MARISVSVPDEMKAEMDSLGYRVNWSGVAQAAFDLEIQRCRWPKEPDMSDVIERLKASKTEFEAREQAEGQQDGRKWAMDKADYEELQTVAGMELWRFQSPFWSAFDRLLGLDDRADSFWTDWDPKKPSDPYVQAFVEGAGEVWSEVSDRL